MNIGIFEFYLRAIERILLPPYKGSTIRGGFGNVFKKVVCTIKNNKMCNNCILRERCIYSYIFETKPPSDTKIMRKYERVPHPFIIEPPYKDKIEYNIGEIIEFNLILIGRAIDYLPYFIYTFDELGKIGIGKGRGKYELKSVKIQKSMIKSEEIYSSDTKILKPFKINPLSLQPLSLGNDFTYLKNLTLYFLTPTRIIHNGHLIFDLEFHIFIRNLLRRIALIYYFHCGGSPFKIRFKELIYKAMEIKVRDRNLKWYDWERYSAKQDIKIKMGGFIGNITFEGDINKFIPYINIGEYIHVGKGTSFGLGKYEVSYENF